MNDIIMVMPYRNPIGRTGMTGRGLLGKWGPNHAADPIVTRWKKDSKGARVVVNGKPRLEFVAIKRRDTGEWALPGVRRDGGVDTAGGGVARVRGEGESSFIWLCVHLCAYHSASITLISIGVRLLC